MAKRTITADVASRRHRTAVTMNTGLSEYGSTKFGMTPGGGVRAGTLLGLVVFIMLRMLTVDEAGKYAEREAPAEQVYRSHEFHSSWLLSLYSFSLKEQSSGAQSLKLTLSEILASKDRPNPVNRIWHA